jgi:phosphate starvation-inducible PhoH-like protein
MPRKRVAKKTTQRVEEKKKVVDVSKGFQLNFLNASQRLAWQAYQAHDLLIMLGPAGCGKTHLATGFAITEILQKTKKKIVLTRPIVESYESLGYLPGELSEKVQPYMMPFYDSISKLCGNDLVQKDIIKSSLELIPLAYMRGRSLENSVFILDEAQNCTKEQLKLAVTRLGRDSKMVITADPEQSDLRSDVAIVDFINKIKSIHGIGIIEFKSNSIVRHPLISKILDKV